MIQNEMQKVERGTFRAAVDIGVWDILIATLVSMFAIAPLLSGSLGDFWSSAIFVPILAAVYLALQLVKRRLVLPRIGVVRFASYRQARLRRLFVVLAAVNVVALALGTFFALRFEPGNGLSYTIVFSLTALAAFSLAGYFLNIPRFFFYGLLIAIAPFVGEWLFRKGYAPHHGYPVVFGTAAALIATVGLITLILRVRGVSPLGDGPLAGEDR